MQRKHIQVAAAVAMLVTQATYAQALKYYDRFTTSPIDSSLWTTGERSIAIRGGTLNMSLRAFGITASNSGLTYSEMSEGVTDPASVTAFGAKITVNSIGVPACVANSSPGQSRARIIGSYFNVGTPVAGSNVNDVHAQIKLSRYSDSTDPTGTLEVLGILNICTDTACNNTSPIGSTVPLGTVTVGQAATVLIQWQKSTKTFYFSRDNDAYSGSVSYTQSDASPPSNAFKSLSMRFDLPECVGTVPVEGSIAAAYDDVVVNRKPAQ